MRFRHAATFSLVVFIFHQQSILLLLFFFSFSFHANTFLRRFEPEKTIFKLLHQCGLVVVVCVKQFVSEGKKVNGPLGTIEPKELPLLGESSGTIFRWLWTSPGSRNNTCATLTYICFCFSFENNNRVYYKLILI